MILNVNQDSNIWIASFQPEVTRFTLATIDSVKKELENTITLPQVKMILDMGNIEFIDSSGIGCILSLIRNVEKNEGEVLLCNSSPRIMELFQMLHLTHLADSDQTLTIARERLSN